MRTNVRDSSFDCYHGHVVGAIEDEQSLAIAACVKRLGKCTRRMVAQETGIETSTVSARVNKLKKPGGLLIESEELAKCPISGIRVHWLTHRDNARGQLGLFA